MIFNLFKSKPTLKELIPQGFIDIHSHILPGIDDGAKNIKNSISIINEMRRLGFKKIIATPHIYPGLYQNDSVSIKKSFERISNNIPKEICVEYAAEYMIDSSLFKLVEEKSLLCIKDNYVLVETSFMGVSDIIFEIIFKLRMNGYIPILAHPERYLYTDKKLKFFSKLKNQGCMFQINLLSITGFYGKEVVMLSDKLLKNNFIDFCGSDIHSLKHVECFNNMVKIDNTKILLEKLESYKEFL